MYAVGRLGSYISRGVYTVSGPFHPFGGAVDIIVVEQPDGNFRSSPWYVRFGKFQGVLKRKEKVVRVCVNGDDAGFHMHLDHKGEAYFLREVEGGGEDAESNLSTSSSSDESPDRKSLSSEKIRRPAKSKSCNFDANVPGTVDLGEEEIVAGTEQRRSRIFGLFRRRSVKEVSFRGEGDGLGPDVGRVDSLERAEIAADLLEVQWSTSLATKKHRKDSSSRFSNRRVLDSKLGDVCCIDDERTRRDSESQPQKDVESPLEDAGTEFSCLNSQEGVIDIKETSEIMTETVTYYDEYSVGGEVNEKVVSVLQVRTDSSHELSLCESSQISHLGLSRFAEGDAKELHPEKMLVQSGALYKDASVIESERTYDGSPEPILLDSLDEETNEGRDDLIIGDGNRGDLQLKLEPVSNMDDPLSDGDFSKSACSPSSESSEEPLFEFSDLDDPKISKKANVNRNLQEPASDEKANSFLEDSNQERSHVDSGDANGKAASSPIDIARISHILDDDGDVGRLAESMPVMRSRIENINSYLLPAPLSQSLEIDAKALDLSNLCLADDSQVKLEDRDLLNKSRSDQIPKEAGNVILSPDIELSLCRHMLYEGMGTEAASQAFESEKLDREKFTCLSPTVMKDDRLVVRIGARYFPWEAAMPIVLGLVSFGSELVTESKGMIAVEKKSERTLEDDLSRVTSPSRRSWNLWPFSFKRSPSGKIMQDTATESSADEKEVSAYNTERPDEAVVKPKPVKKTVRSITPTSEQLASLNLKEGSNTVTFTFSTRMLGDQRVDARIYLWKWNTRIIISDVDGTITKSDVLGQFMPLVGMDWSQTGVAHLFSAIKENGYQLLFLSARAISQAYHTRQFLFNLKQDGKGLPDGPVVISPDGLFPSLYREVIRRAPHEFKIACLEEIKALFPPDCSPFYAGFGNRNTDEISYLKVGIPKGKIFTINPKGEVAVNRHINTKSYTSLHSLVHGMFPPTAKSEQEDFNSWNFWKLPPPDIDI